LGSSIRHGTRALDVALENIPYLWGYGRHRFSTKRTPSFLGCHWIIPLEQKQEDFPCYTLFVSFFSEDAN
jgi:hypothetical protein